jgi:hypothetical protein
VGLSKEIKMRKYVRVLTTSAVILAGGAIAASGQPPGAQTPQPKAEDGDQDGFHGYHPGMIGPGMMGGGMMGHGYGHHEWYRGRGVMEPMMARIIFSLMDADGDGKLSLQEFQAAHERIFKAMDANKDGFVTLEEMQDFIRGTSKPASQQ